MRLPPATRQRYPALFAPNPGAATRTLEFFTARIRNWRPLGKPHGHFVTAISWAKLLI